MIGRLFALKGDKPFQTRNAFRISLIAIFAAILTASVYLVQAAQTGAWQLYAWSADIWILAVASVICHILIRRDRVSTGMWLLLVTIQVTFLAAVALIDETGLTIGLSLAILTAIIAGQTLPAKQVTPAIAMGTISGVTAILFELFSQSYRYPQPPFIRIYLPGILIAVILLFVYLTAQQFRNYLLRTKLIIVFLTIVFASVGAVTLLTSVTLRASLAEDVGDRLNTLVTSKAVEIGQALKRESDVLKTLAYNQLVQEMAVDSNARGHLDQQEIGRLDDKWMAANAADNNSDALVTSVLSNQLADELRRFQAEFPQHTEIFLTNQQGVNIAATNRTSDYYQADEDWWQIAYRDGLYIGQPEYDESSDTVSIIMATTVQAPDTENTIGILRTTITVSALTDALVSGLFGQTGHTDIYLPNGKEIELEAGEDGSYEVLLVDSELAPDALNQMTGKYQELMHNNRLTLASQAKVNIPGATGTDAAAIENLDWNVVALQDQSEAFQVIETQTRNLLLTTIAISILVTFAAIGLAQVLSSPITRLTSVANKFASGDLSAQASVEARDEIGLLASTFNEMTAQIKNFIGSLEQRVTERTADVEMARSLSDKRARELQSVSEISRTISTEQRLDILLPLITRLVSERFNFYHVGIFFVDETRQFAHLQAANSEGGQRMLANGHRLELGFGLVGDVAQTGRPRIALDVGSDAVFFDNPELPDTRSEMALPLNIRGRAIGVLDVQSTKPGAFSENDVNTLGILADQVAIAIENARLFTQTQQAREEAEALYGQILRQEWSAFEKQEPHIGYRRSAVGGKLLEAPVVTDEIRMAVENGRVIAIDAGDNGSHPAIAVPVKLRGQTIGVLNIKAPTKNRKWSQDEINLVQAVSDRLALALDNARLLHESQRRAAREAKIGEVSAKISASINMRNVLQTAVEELGRALPGSEVLIQFKDVDGEKPR
ncbi:MAG: hypothetical protein C3F07_01575 [Anaerolineales bacterium]|nr:MAG: hypothetical protein C3F07_01575 [Anaerolineales bacterium]